MFIEEDNKLKATFEFKDFKAAFAFMTEIALHAEAINHHPNWSNVWNKVQIELYTYSAGNIVTEKDHTLAALIILSYKKYIS